MDGTQCPVHTKPLSYAPSHNPSPALQLKSFSSTKKIMVDGICTLGKTPDRQLLIESPAVKVLTSSWEKRVTDTI